MKLVLPLLLPLWLGFSILGSGQQSAEEREWLVAEERRILRTLTTDGLPRLTCDTVLNTTAFQLREPRKFVVVTFWAPWCSPCKPLLQALGRLQAASPSDLVIRTVAQVSPEQGLPLVVKELAKANLKAATCVYADDSQRKAWQAEGIPQTFLFLPSGDLERVASGGDRGTVLAERLLGGWRPGMPW